MDHIFFNLFELYPEDEDHSIFAIILARKISKDTTGAMVLLSFEEPREIKAQSWKQADNRHSYLLSKIKPLQFCLKNFQEKYCYHSMVVSTILPSMIQNSENSSMTLLQFSKLVVKGTLDLSHHLHENAAWKTFLVTRSTGILPRRQKVTASHLSSRPLFYQKMI